MRKAGSSFHLSCAGRERDAAPARTAGCTFAVEIGRISFARAFGSWAARAWSSSSDSMSSSPSDSSSAGPAGAGAGGALRAARGICAQTNTTSALII